MVGWPGGTEGGVPGAGAGLTGLLSAVLTGAALVRSDSVETASDAGGAYALMIRLDAPVLFQRGGREDLLCSGEYVYAGSAYGPGGLRARLRRHFRRDKAMRWHVDRLTVAAGWMQALAFEGGSECGIIRALEQAGAGKDGSAFVHPAAGFGSSDCRTCASHLLFRYGSS